jgi:hypothetical protein
MDRQRQTDRQTDRHSHICQASQHPSIPAPSSQPSLLPGHRYRHIHTLNIILVHHQITINHLSHLHESWVRWEVKELSFYASYKYVFRTCAAGKETARPTKSQSARAQHCTRLRRREHQQNRARADGDFAIPQGRTALHCATLHQQAHFYQHSGRRFLQCSAERSSYCV